MGPFLDADEVREDLLTGRIEQKRGSTVLRASRDGADGMTDESTRKFGNKEDRRAGGLYLPGTQSPQRARRCCDTDTLGGIQVGRVARRTVVVVPLHVAVRDTEDRAAEGMTGSGVAADETVRVPVRAHAAVCPRRRTFRV